MRLADIYSQFNACHSWEDRFRLLIQYSRKLAKPSEQQLLAWHEIEGCESRLWFEFQLEPRQINTYSDARLMQGLLFITQIALTESSAEQLKSFNLQQLFDELQIARHLTHTRLNGLAQISKIVRDLSACS